MRVPTEVRKQDLKKAIVFVVIGAGLFAFLYMKWFKSAEAAKSRVEEQVREVQAKFLDSTQAEGKLNEIKGKVTLLREVVQNLESSLPAKVKLSGNYGKDIIDAMNENNLVLLSINNSELENVKGLYRIEYTVSLNGKYTDILNFMRRFERDLWMGWTKLNFKILKEDNMDAQLTLILYGVDM